MQNSNYLDKLNQLENKFSQGSIDTFELQQKVFNLYKKEPKTVEMKESIFNFIEKLTRKTIDKDEDNSVNKEKWMWPIFFEADQQMWGRLHILETRLLAERSLTRYINNDKDTDLLKAAGSLAYITIKTMDESSFTQLFKNQVRSVWLEVFKDYPNFETVLATEEQHWKDFHKQLQSKYANSKESNERTVTDSYTFQVPAVIRTANIEDILLNSELYALTQYIVDEFNSFKLEGYMDPIGKDCVKSSVTYKDQTFTFKFYYSRKLDLSEITNLQTELRGQLSDGWGESIEQHEALIDNELVSIGFDYEHIKQMPAELVSTTPTI